MGATLVEGTRDERPPIVAWEEVEARRFLAVADASEDASLWRLLLTTGIRIGEALSLRWAAIDLDTAIMQVRSIAAPRRGCA